MDATRFLGAPSSDLASPGIEWNPPTRWAGMRIKPIAVSKDSNTRIRLQGLKAISTSAQCYRCAESAHLANPS